MANVCLKLMWLNGGVEIDCPAELFEATVSAAEKLLMTARLAGGVQFASGEPDASAPAVQPADEKKVAKPKTRKPRAASSGAGEKSKLGTAKYEDFVDFKWDLNDEAEKKLVQFYQQKAPKTQNERVAVILYALRSFAGKDRPTYDEIYKAYRMVDRNDPIKNLAGVVSNMQVINLLVREDDGIRLKVFGEELVDRDLPHAEKAK